MLVYAGIWLDTDFRKRLVLSAVSVEIPKYLGSSLSGVECRDKPGAQHRITAPHRQAALPATHAVALACPTRDGIALESTPIPAA